jgi:hypothetical protein
MVPICNLLVGLQLSLRSSRLTQKTDLSEAIKNLALLMVGHETGISLYFLRVSEEEMVRLRSDSTIAIAL